MMKLSRRNFIKGTAAAVGGVALTKGIFQKVDADNKVANNEALTFEPKHLDYYPPFEKWNSWKEPAGDYWKKEGGALRDGVKLIDYMIVPTVCNNCEAACGLTAWIDKESMVVRKFMGNPFHSGSRGRNCAKGYAALAQMYDPDRIPFPLKRAPGSKRGENKWVRTTWEEALETIGKKMREVLLKGDEISKKQINYHVGRPNEMSFNVKRVVWSWGVDGRNSHTNICSSNGRFGAIICVGDDRTSPDFGNSKLILLNSSHAADAGHYYQQHAGYIADARAKGAKLVVIDPRLSNSAGMADLWIPAWPGTEAALYIAILNRLIQENKFDRKFVERWTNWKQLMKDKEYLNYLKENGYISELPKGETFDDFIELLKDMYKDYTFEWAAQECRIPVEMIDKLYEMVVYAGNAITNYQWRGPAAGNRGGWVVGRAMNMLLTFTGSIGSVGGTGWHHWHVIDVGDKGGDACMADKPDPVKVWNELHYPPEWPLSSYELSYIYPHLLMDDEWRKKWQEKGLKIPDKVEVWFSRIYNPVWINPDGFRWVEALKDENKFGLTVYMSPTWAETAFYCDYILPMGLAGERHDQHSSETKPERWTGFRQPVLRVALMKMGWKPNDPAKATLEAHKKVGLGEIWEENEFFINLAFAIDPDGSLGIRKYWESKQNPGKPVTIEEYYNAAFSKLPKLSEICKQLGITPYEYMRDRGAWTEETNIYYVMERPLPYDQEKGVYKYKGKEIPKSAIKIDEELGIVYAEEEGKKHTIGVYKDGKILQGFHTPSGHIEFYSPTLKDWKWPEYAVLYYPKNKEQRQKMIHIVSHVHHDYIAEENAFVLNPIYRLPYLIHTRSINAKWLMEIGQNHNPLWIYEKDAKRLGINRGDAVKVWVVDTLTGIKTGYFVAMATPTQATRPGVVACSHHNGRWRLVNEVKIDGFKHPLGVMRLGSVLVDIKNEGSKYFMRTKEGVKPFESWQFPEFNKDTELIWWKGTTGVFQNAVFPANPDPISGMHCWHKKVLIEKAGPEDRIGDVFVDIQKTFEVYKAWRDQLTRPAPGPGGLRRPKWMPRPWVPLADEAYKMPGSES
jgi:anaerobic selenocysteine-containing dehydrogenase